MCEMPREIPHEKMKEITEVVESLAPEGAAIVVTIMVPESLGSFYIGTNLDPANCRIMLDLVACASRDENAVTVRTQHPR